MVLLSVTMMCSDVAVMQMCLIMDEVDGMSAGDRGGVADLIQTLKGAKLPIICICNDKYNQKLKSLRNHCLELDFRCKPCSSSLCILVPPSHAWHALCLTVGAFGACYMMGHHCSHLRWKQA